MFSRFSPMVAVLCAISVSAFAQAAQPTDPQIAHIAYTAGVLDKLTGAAFDRAYIANEVAYHKTVNGALQTTLIPSSSNAELKSLLQTGLKLFQGHQQHAEQTAAKAK